MTRRDWESSECLLLPLQIVPPGEKHSGLLSRGCLQVHSSSVIIGGSAFDANQTSKYLPTEEEILFFERPEMLVANLMTAPLLDQEAIHIVGAEKFSQAEGVGLELRFGKPVLDDTHRAEDGTVLHAITCIDPMDECGASTPWSFDLQSKLPPRNPSNGVQLYMLGISPEHTVH